MTHSLTLVENTRDDVHRRLKNPPPVAFGQHTSPRLLNRQIKFLLSTLHHDLLKGILQRIQEALRHSSKKPSWAALFASMVVLAMTTESQEVAVRCKESTDKKERVIEVDDSTAEKAIGLMDEQFEFLSKLFHQRYRTPFKKGFNPLLNVDNRNELDIESRLLADKSAEIVKTYRESLPVHRSFVFDGIG